MDNTVVDSAIGYLMGWETWKLCGHLWRPSCMPYFYRVLGGGHGPLAPWIHYCNHTNRVILARVTCGPESESNPGRSGERWTCYHGATKPCMSHLPSDGVGNVAKNTWRIWNHYKHNRGFPKFSGPIELIWKMTLGGSLKLVFVLAIIYLLYIVLLIPVTVKSKKRNYTLKTYYIVYN